MCSNPNKWYPAFTATAFYQMEQLRGWKGIPIVPGKKCVEVIKDGTRGYSEIWLCNDVSLSLSAAYNILTLYRMRESFDFQGTLMLPMRLNELLRLANMYMIVVTFYALLASSLWKATGTLL